MQNKCYKIVDKFKFLICIALVIMLVGIGFNIFKGVKLDINFSGGTTISYSYEGDIDTEKVQKTVEDTLKKYDIVTYVEFKYSGDIKLDEVLKSATAAFTDGEAVGIEAGEGTFKVCVESAAKLTDAQIKGVEDKLVSAFADNKVAIGEITEKQMNIQVALSKSQDYTTGTSTVVVSVIGNTALSKTEQDAISTALVDGKDYADNKFELASSNSVDKTVGGGFFTKSLYALLIASLLVIVYVGIRFRNIGGISASVTALIALVHDVFIVYFANVILGLTIDANFIAVILTILGYSLNDTIVIYDRVRENTGLYDGQKSIREIVNLSISQSLKRTMVTSITTFVAIMCVTVVALIAGLDSILSFSVPMSIGTIAGSFSSICLAGPLYVFWAEFKQKKGLGKKAKKQDKTSYVNRKNPKKKTKKSAL